MRLSWERVVFDERIVEVCLRKRRVSYERHSESHATRIMAKDEGDDMLPDKDAAKGFYAKYEPKEILGRYVPDVLSGCVS